MLRRLGTLAVAIVVAALPSLNRICLTGCDSAQFASARAERPDPGRAPHDELAPEQNDENCPLHASESSPAAPTSPDAPASPSPCQHQQEWASADYVRCPNLVHDSDHSSIIVSPATASGPLRAAIDVPVTTRHPISPRRPPNALVLRI